jgi:predicted metal-dependent hydrolase
MLDKLLNDSFCEEVIRLYGVQVKSYRQAKRIKLISKSEQGLILSLPADASINTIKKFLESNLNWLAEQKALQPKPIFNDGYKFKTLNYEYEFISSELKELRYRKTGHKYKIYLPAKTNASFDKTKELTLKLLRKEANEYLHPRLEFFASKFNLKYEKLRIKDLKSIWGSCSSMKNINLSLYLVKLPSELCDYVLCHELCHLLHQDHSGRFWHTLDQMYPGADRADRALKKYHPLKFDYCEI